MKININDFINIMNIAINNDSINKNVFTLDNMEEDFVSLGVDSLEYINIIIMLEEQYQCVVPDEKLIFNESNNAFKLFNLFGEILDNES